MVKRKGTVGRPGMGLEASARHENFCAGTVCFEVILAVSDEPVMARPKETDKKRKQKLKEILDFSFLEI